MTGTPVTGTPVTGSTLAGATTTGATGPLSAYATADAAAIAVAVASTTSHGLVRRWFKTINLMGTSGKERKRGKLPRYAHFDHGRTTDHKGLPVRENDADTSLW
ncbi:hypothetical protein GCM10014715_45930 [Streptomyces spiralis]|uniref:Uncharacterized protein n=1 Tax=Streptomyces spiralis TaxID=66376 RepID=A0A919A304_9ACTN|nr:hypothetical protein GCM10014715_45930 [Streptomyces spiralis]